MITRTPIKREQSNVRFQFTKYLIPIRKYYFECRKTPPLSDFFLPTAYMHCYEKAHPWFFSAKEGHTLTNDLTISEEDLFATFQKKTRSYIRKADKEACFTLDDGPDLGEFREFVHEFANKRELSYYELDALKELGHEYYDILALRGDNGKIALAHMYLCSPKKRICSLLISAADDSGREDAEKRQQMGRANRLLHWQAMRRLKAAGYATYDWGGYALNTEDPVLQGINSFKQRFNGTLRTVYHYYSPAYALIKWLKRDRN
jgi:hypothetical protein